MQYEICEINYQIDLILTTKRTNVTRMIQKLASLSLISLVSFEFSFAHLTRDIVVVVAVVVSTRKILWLPTCLLPNRQAEFYIWEHSLVYLEMLS